MQLDVIGPVGGTGRVRVRHRLAKSQAMQSSPPSRGRGGSGSPPSSLPPRSARRSACLLAEAAGLLHHQHRHGRPEAAPPRRLVRNRSPSREPKPAAIQAAAVNPPPNYSGFGKRRGHLQIKPQRPPDPSAVPGLAWYTVTDTDSNYRVTAYTVTENAKPAMSNRERLVLTQGIYLPSDARQSGPNTDTCIVSQREAEAVHRLGVRGRDDRAGFDDR